VAVEVTSQRAKRSMIRRGVVSMGQRSYFAAAITVNCSSKTCDEIETIYICEVGDRESFSVCKRERLRSCSSILSKGLFCFFPRCQRKC
jgi:hypothetical protein